jgi:hypothetical protein
VEELAEAVSVEVCDELLLLKVSEESEKLHVGSVELAAPDGLLVTAQVSETVSVNELPGVTVMVLVPLEP